MAIDVYKKMKHYTADTLQMKEVRKVYDIRLPSNERLVWAKELISKMGDIGRAHVWTPVTATTRMPSSAWKKTHKKKKNNKHNKHNKHNNIKVPQNEAI